MKFAINCAFTDRSAVIELWDGEVRRLVDDLEALEFDHVT